MVFCVLCAPEICAGVWCGRGVVEDGERSKRAGGFEVVDAGAEFAWSFRLLLARRWSGTERIAASSEGEIRTNLSCPAGGEENFRGCLVCRWAVVFSRRRVQNGCCCCCRRRNVREQNCERVSPLGVWGAAPEKPARLIIACYACLFSRSKSRGFRLCGLVGVTDFGEVDPARSLLSILGRAVRGWVCLVESVRWKDGGEMSKMEFCRMEQRRLRKDERRP